MKALVLGATGHIGNAIVRALVERGYDVGAANRRDYAPNLEGLQIRHLRGDQNIPGQFDKWIPGYDVVIDAAVPYPVDLYDKCERARWRTAMLLEAARRHDVILGFVSSFTTLKRWAAKLEEYPTQVAKQLHPYFATKQLVEDLVLEASDQGLRVAIVNPTMCFGPWDYHDRELCLVPRLLSGEVPGYALHNLNVIDVREVASGMLAAIESERFGERLLFSGHNISTQMLFRWICEMGGAEPPTFSAPSWMAVLAGYLAETILGYPTGETPLKSLAPMLVYQHEWMPPSRALEDLGVRVRPLSETLEDSVSWYREIGYC